MSIFGYPTDPQALARLKAFEQSLDASSRVLDQEQNLVALLELHSALIAGQRHVEELSTTESADIARIHKKATALIKRVTDKITAVEKSQPFKTPKLHTTQLGKGNQWAYNYGSYQNAACTATAMRSLEELLLHPHIKNIEVDDIVLFGTTIHQNMLEDPEIATALLITGVTNTFFAANETYEANTASFNHIAPAPFPNGDRIKTYPSITDANRSAKFKEAIDDLERISPVDSIGGVITINGTSFSIAIKVDPFTHQKSYRVFDSHGGSGNDLDIKTRKALVHEFRSKEELVKFLTDIFTFTAETKESDDADLALIKILSVAELSTEFTLTPFKLRPEEPRGSEQGSPSSSSGVSSAASSSPPTPSATPSPPRKEREDPASSSKELTTTTHTAKAPQTRSFFSSTEFRLMALSLLIIYFNRKKQS